MSLIDAPRTPSIGRDDSIRAHTISFPTFVIRTSTIDKINNSRELLFLYVKLWGGGGKPIDHLHILNVCTAKIVVFV